MPIHGFGEVVGAYPGWGERVGRSESDRPAAPRPERADRDGKAREGVEALCRIVTRPGEDVELEIGAVDVRRALQKGEDRGCAHGQRATPAEGELKRHQRLAGEAVQPRVECRNRHAVGVVEFQVILQSAADPRTVQRGCDAHRRQVIRRSQPRQHEKLRRADGAGRKQHFAVRARLPGRSVRADVPHALRPSIGDQHRGDMGVGDDAQVGAPAYRVEVAMRTADPPALPGRGLVVAHARLAGAVAVRIVGQAEVQCRLAKQVRDPESHAAVRHADRPVAAMPVVGASLLAFGTLEPGQHVRERPPGRHLAPVGRSPPSGRGRRAVRSPRSIRPARGHAASPVGGRSGAARARCGSTSRAPGCRWSGSTRRVCGSRDCGCAPRPRSTALDRRDRRSAGWPGRSRRCPPRRSRSPSRRAGPSRQVKCVTSFGIGSAVCTGGSGAGSYFL